MMKAILSLVLFAVLLLGLMRAGNALLIHDDAVVVVKPSLCSTVGGNMKDQGCTVHADISHEFFSEDPVLRLKDGRILRMQSRDVLAYSFSSSRYSLSW